MRHDLLALLACPSCQRVLTAASEREEDGEIHTGTLTCTQCGARYPIVNFIPRFVPTDNYSKSFGFQWNRFRRTQLDSHTGRPITRQRFFSQSAWQPEEMSGKWTLDLGCGAGRFAEISLSTGTRLVAVDYSGAVDACRANLGPHPRLDVVQADVYRLPFHRARFDFVYCFGVLQHTPDVEGAFAALTQQVAPDGHLAVDLYPETILNRFWPKYWLRPFSRKIPPERLLPKVERMVDVLWPLSLLLGRTPVVGRKLRHVVPVANYEGILPLDAKQLKDWAVLDTFDMLAPAHDYPQSVATVRRWFERASLDEVEVFRRGLVVGRGRRPTAARDSG